MIESEIGIDILDGFCRCTQANTPIDFDIDNVYLGLLTVLPKNDETPCDDDGNYCKEPTDPAYRRIQLNAKHVLNQVPYISRAKEGEGNEADSVYVENDAYIMFDETSDAENGGNWGTIAGFGLFTKQKDNDLPCELPYLWGTITTPDDESVTVGAEEIPIIGKGNFKISLR